MRIFSLPLRFGKWLVLIPAGLALCSLAGSAVYLWLATPRSTSGGIHMSWPPNDSNGGRSIVRLMAVGDTGTGGPGQYKVAAAMEAVCNQAKKKKFDGILLLGDNFYPAGVASTEDPQWQEKFERPYGSPCLATMPFYPVLGNHDYRLSPQAQIDYSLVQSRWRMPGRFYSVDFGPVARLIALDTQHFDWCGSPRDCVYDFMKSRIASAKGAWTILTGHHPMASSSAHGRSYDGTYFKHTIRDTVCKQADFYLAGHAHQLEHLQLDGCKTDFIVAGAGGADIGRLKEDRPGSKFVQAKSGFVTMELEDGKATVMFHDDEGRQIYRYEKLKAEIRS